jgi:hypothetical protein
MVRNGLWPLRHEEGYAIPFLGLIAKSRQRRRLDYIRY